MKYALVFVLVFLCGLGILQFFNNQDTTNPELISVSDKSESEQIDKVISDSSNISLSPSLQEEDTTTYKLVDGHFDLTWNDLAKVDFEERFNDDLSTMVAYPIFHPSIKKLDGQMIQLKGYVIPFEETGDETIVILSAFPFTSCFFCGGAGPETVMDVQLKKQKTRFKQDAMVTFRGKLRLNDSDLDYLNYILDEAVVFEK